MHAGVIGTAHYAAPELLNGFEDEDNHSSGQVEKILKSDVYRYRSSTRFKGVLAFCAYKLQNME